MTRRGRDMHEDWRIHDHNELWDDSDIRKLIEGRRAGKTDEELARYLGRTKKALQSKAARLRAKGFRVPTAQR